MTFEEIQELVKKDEHRCLELKKTTGELQDGMHSACAFLNTDGGWLIFGVAPNSLKIVFRRTMNGNDSANDSLNDSLNDSVNNTYLTIKANPGIQRKRISELTGKSIPTVDRHIALLAKASLIEHRDSDKAGGYYAK